MLTQQQFSALLPQGLRLLGYAGMVDNLPPAAVAGLEGGPAPEQLEWLSYPVGGGSEVGKALR